MYASMREGCPVAHSDRYGGYEYVSRYADVKAIMADPATYTSGEGVFIPDTGLPRLPALEFDAPEHTTIRAIMYNRLLTPRAVRAFEPTISESANRLIDSFADRGTADLAPEFAEQLPAIVVG
ncbi:hypothetical protein [Mycolicibacterium chlorophenolicum]|nr:hypothetical protein [Mycolicibacterium chlorophenolicum]